MRRLFLLLSLFVSVVSFGQQRVIDPERVQRSNEEVSDMPQRSPEDIAEYQTLMLRRDLDLTEEQVKQVYVINLKYAQLGRPQNRQQAEERIKQKLSDLKAVLTEQQYDTFMRKTSEVKHFRGGMKLLPMQTDSSQMKLRVKS